MKIFLKALKKSLAKPRTFVLCYFATVQYYMERNGTVMLKIIDDFVWGVPLIVLILAVGIFLTIRLRGTSDHEAAACGQTHYCKRKRRQGRRGVEFRRTLHGAVGNDRYR